MTKLTPLEPCRSRSSLRARGNGAPAIPDRPGCFEQTRLTRGGGCTAAHCARSSTDRAAGFYPAGWGFESLRARIVAVGRAGRSSVARSKSTLTAKKVAPTTARPTEWVNCGALLASCAGVADTLLGGGVSSGPGLEVMS